MKNYLLSTFLILLGCSGEQPAPLNEVAGAPMVQQQAGPSKNSATFVQVEGTNGVLVLREGIPFKLVISEDTLLSHSHSIKSLDDHFFKENDWFAFHKDYGVIAFRSETLSGSWYKVLTQGQKVYYVHVSSSMVFEDWETHLMKSSFVYPLNGNLFRESPLADSKPVNVSKDELFSAKEIDGEWLGVQSLDDTRKELLWVKWRDQGRLLVEIFYFC